MQQILFTTKFFLSSEEVPYQAKSLGYYTKYLLKKIVALALCLVLALSLCATAFAAADKTYNNVYLKENVKGASVSTTAVNLEYYKAVAPKFDDDGYNTKTTATIEHYEITDGGTTTYYVSSSKADADVIVYTDANTVLNDSKAAYLKELDSAYDVKIIGKGVAAPKFGTACGLLDEDKLDEDETYYVLGGEVYKAVDENAEGLLKVGEKYVSVVDTSEKLTDVVVAHKIVVASKDGKTTAVSCSKCNRTATKVGGAAAIPDGTADYNIYVDGTTYWVFTGSGTTSSDKVDSAKTFDAGIALYVGMSISAVAGSAVVIGKKKEF